VQAVFVQVVAYREPLRSMVQTGKSQS
jgi:hypothetical protein